jgi:hypothetical protein
MLTALAVVIETVEEDSSGKTSSFSNIFFSVTIDYIKSDRT